MFAEDGEEQDLFSRLIKFMDLGKSVNGIISITHYSLLITLFSLSIVLKPQLELIFRPNWKPSLSLPAPGSGSNPGPLGLLDTV